ncbi:MAG: hypothetical protein AAB948_00235 [Patescibacteria group bacterium]|mgnify:CR=1 FL=1
MPKEIAIKTKEETYYKCAHCGDEIFWNTHKKLTYCKCKKIWVDGCEDYVRIGGDKGDYEVIKKRILKNKTTKKIYDQLGPEFAVARMVINKRIKHDLT